jgi:hypothetical protein
MTFRVFVKIGRKQGPLDWDGQLVTIGVDSPPVDGAANKQLVEVISDWLGVSKSMVRVTKGHTARYKTVEVELDQIRFDQLLADLPHQEKLL